MQKPVPTTRILDNSSHISVLSGDKKISDMLVFLMYRKLKYILSEKAETKEIKE